MPLHSGATRGGNEIPCQFGMRHKLSLLSGRVVRLTAKGFCSQPGRAGAELGLKRAECGRRKPSFSSVLDLLKIQVGKIKFDKLDL